MFLKNKFLLKIFILNFICLILTGCVGTTIQQNVDYLEKKINLPNFKGQIDGW